MPKHLGETSVEILRVVGELGVVTSRQVAERVGLTRASVSRTMVRFRALGYLSSPELRERPPFAPLGTGRFEITAKGRKAATHGVVPEVEIDADSAAVRLLRVVQKLDWAASNEVARLMGWTRGRARRTLIKFRDAGYLVSEGDCTRWPWGEYQITDKGRARLDSDGPLKKTDRIFVALQECPNCRCERVGPGPCPECVRLVRLSRG